MRRPHILPVWTHVKHGRNPQASTGVRQQKVVVRWRIPRNQQSRIHWQLVGVCETVSCGTLRSQFISHRCRQQKRSHELQVKVQRTTYLSTLTASVVITGTRGKEESNDGFEYNLHNWTDCFLCANCWGRLCLYSKLFGKTGNVIFRKTRSCRPTHASYM